MNDEDYFQSRLDNLRKDCPLLDEVTSDHRGVLGWRNGEIVVRIKGERGNLRLLPPFRDAYMHAVAKKLIKPREEKA